MTQTAKQLALSEQLFKITTVELCFLNLCSLGEAWLEFAMVAVSLWVLEHLIDNVSQLILLCNS